MKTSAFYCLMGLCVLFWGKNSYKNCKEDGEMKKSLYICGVNKIFLKIGA